MKWHIGLVEYHKLTSHVNYCRNDKNLEIFRFQQNKSLFHVVITAPMIKSHTNLRFRFRLAQISPILNTIY